MEFARRLFRRMARDLESTGLDPFLSPSAHHVLRVRLLDTRQTRVPLCAIDWGELEGDDSVHLGMRQLVSPP